MDGVCRWMSGSGLIGLIAALGMPGASADPAEIPRPEHPFPQMVRADWRNLNGVWEFAETDDSAEAQYLSDQAYPDKITVPFCRESKLSGLARRGFVKNVWYRRTFQKPAEWKSPRVRLHVGACDYRTRVWVNGQLLGEHTGGSAPFAFDVTPHLQTGDNTLVIHAFDDTRSGLQALGKQCPQLESQGCLYTRTTGIWQTVWLEGVGAAFIREARIENDIPGSRVLLQVDADGPCDGLTTKAVALAGKKEVAAAEAPADWRNNRLVLNLPEKHLWSIEDPFLYDLKLMLRRGEQVIDQVDSYFGLREVTIRGAAILINGQAVFQRTVLDQGFYPEGVWSAPSDAALVGDIKMSQAAGFNGARLHQKVFEPRFLHWADKLGYLVWGEFPSWGPDYKNPATHLPFLNEWVEIVRRDRNHPALIGWCPFNETGGDAIPLQNAVVGVTRALDPSRPIIDSSGGSHGLAEPEVLDAHDYEQNPASYRQRWTDSFGPGVALPHRYQAGQSWRCLPFFVSEYGGIGWNVGSGGWGYSKAENLAAFYERYEGLTNALLDNRYIFGFCYTQLTDVEQEQNGIYTFDRKPKFDVARLHKINARQAAYETDPPLQVQVARDDWRILVGACPDGARGHEWRYVMETQPPESWTKPDFDDSAWKLGRAGFGQKGGWEPFIKTPWSGKDIWLRQPFTCDRPEFERAMLVTHYDNGTEVYLNGTLIWKGERWNDGYGGFDVTTAVRPALAKGQNTIAIHCHQDEGGQFIDAALLIAP